MGCIKFKINPSPTFIQYNGRNDNYLLSAYTEQPGRDFHIPAVSMVVFDLVNMDFNRVHNTAYPYSFTPARAAAWYERFENDLVDADGNTIVCSAEYGENIDFEGYKNYTGNPIYDHGYTCDFYTPDGELTQVKDNFYPFNSDDNKKYVKYYEKDAWELPDEPYYVGDTFYLWDRLQIGVAYDEEAKGPVDAFLPDGDAGGWFYGDTFDIYLGFGDIIEYTDDWYYGFKFKVRGTDHWFQVLELAKSQGLPGDIPAVKDPADTNGLYQLDQYYRRIYGGSGNRSRWDHTFFMNQYEEFKLFVQTVVAGKEAYDTEYGPFLYRREQANLRPHRARRRARGGHSH